jgi:hypothetical protein
MFALARSLQAGCLRSSYLLTLPTKTIKIVLALFNAFSCQKARISDVEFKRI